MKLGRGLCVIPPMPGVPSPTRVETTRCGPCLSPRKREGGGGPPPPLSIHDIRTPRRRCILSHGGPYLRMRHKGYGEGRYPIVERVMCTGIASMPGFSPFYFTFMLKRGDICTSALCSLYLQVAAPTTSLRETCVVGSNPGMLLPWSRSQTPWDGCEPLSSARRTTWMDR